MDDYRLTRVINATYIVNDLNAILTLRMNDDINDLLIVIKAYS